MSIDHALDRACNWLAFHPRLTVTLLCAMFELAGLLDRILP